MPVTTLDELPEGAGRAFVINGRRIALFRLGSTVFALDDTCSHADASLSAGELDSDEGCVECPRHGARFDLATGAARTLPAFKPVATHRVLLEGDTVLVELASEG